MFQVHVVKGLCLSLMVLVGSVGTSWGAQWSEQTYGWAKVTSITVQDAAELYLSMEHSGQYANQFGNCNLFMPVTTNLEVIKMLHSVALSAFMSGKKVSVLYDNVVIYGACRFYGIKIAD